MNTKTHSNSSIGIASCLFELKAQASSEIKILPAGQFKARDGRPHGLDGWHLSALNAQAVMASIESQQDDVLIDYDHQTLYTAKTGQPAPAAGWFKSLEWRADGLYALGVDWTAAATKSIESKEYRYISPVLSYNKQTGEITGLLMVALVNYPAIDGLTDLAAAHFNFNQDIEPMASALGDLLSQLMKQKNITAQQMASAAGIEAETVEQILSGSIERPPEQRLTGFAKVLGVSVERLKKALPEKKVSAALQALLGVNEDASETEINAAALVVQTKLDQAVALATQVGAPDPAKYVPVETMTAISHELAALSKQVNDKSCADLITEALSCGKLLPAQKGWANSLELVALQSYLATAQPIAALSSMQADGKNFDQQGKAVLSEQQLAVCSQMGIDPEEYKLTLEQA